MSFSGGHAKRGESRKHSGDGDIAPGTTGTFDIRRRQTESMLESSARIRC